MSLYKCPAANGMVCIQECGCCAKCKHTESGISSRDCACGLWRRAKEAIETQESEKE